MTQITAENTRQIAIEKIVKHGFGGKITLESLIRFANHPKYGKDVGTINLTDVFKEVIRVWKLQQEDKDPFEDETESEQINTTEREEIEDTEMTETTTETTTEKKTRKAKIVLTEDQVKDLSTRVQTLMSSKGGTMAKKVIVSELGLDEFQVTAGLKALQDAGKVTCKKGRHASWTLT